MRVSDDSLQRQIAVCLVMFLVAPFVNAATARQPQTQPGRQAKETYSVPGPSENFDHATNKLTADMVSEASFAVPNAPRSQEIDQNQPSSTSQSTPEPQQDGASNPVGTAVAPYEKTTGIAASRPAGAAIAPAKQRRTRSILIKVGVILGAAIAVGTVAALSKATPSKPN